MSAGRTCSVTLDDIGAARERIAGAVRRTPLVQSDWLGERAGGPVHLKLETLQVTHSFKARGALNAAAAVAHAAPAQASPATIVTASAGNHGRAIAWACERLGLRAIVFTPADAPRAKTDAIRRHGAVLHDMARDYDEAETLAQAFAREHGAAFISPYDHPDVIAGAGTIGLELLEDLPDVGIVVVPIGGGGLISGIAVAVKSLRPAARVVGVEVEASTPYSTARAAGRIVRIDIGETIADGLGGNVDPETGTWPFIRDLVDTIVVVGERDVREMVRALLDEEHLVVEGAGAAAPAAVRAGLISFGGDRGVVLLTGANIDLARLRPLLEA